ncbi:hypothetical protein BaRGS_00015529, partial [Batillaria attramentaria]
PMDCPRKSFTGLYWSNQGSRRPAAGGRRCGWTCLGMRCLCAALCLAASLGHAGGTIVK